MYLANGTSRLLPVATILRDKYDLCRRRKKKYLPIREINGSVLDLSMQIIIQDLRNDTDDNRRRVTIHRARLNTRVR